MKSVLLDTSAYIQFAAGDQRVADVIEDAPATCLSTVVLGELLVGYAPGTRWEAGRTVLDDFLLTVGVRVWAVDSGTAHQYASLYNLLKRQGQMIPVNDLWIAATPLEHDLMVLTADGHFTELPIDCLLLD